MRLSIAVIAMSNLPSMRLVSWNTELGVGVIFTSRPFLAKRAFSCATQIGQLKPPGKTITLTIRGGAGAAGGGTGSAGAGAAGVGGTEAAGCACGTVARGARAYGSVVAISLLRRGSSFSAFLPVRSELQPRLRVQSRDSLKHGGINKAALKIVAKLRD